MAVSPIIAGFCGFALKLFDCFGHSPGYMGIPKGILLASWAFLTVLHSDLSTYELLIEPVDFFTSFR